MNMSDLPSAKPLLQVNDLRVSLPTARGWAQALRGVSWRMERGQTVGLIGESGSGKSLTALALMGLLPERARVSGSITLQGQELVGLPEPQMCQLRGARMAMIFQEPMTALNPLHPIWKQIAEPLRLHQHMSASDAKARALQLLERVQLPRARERLDAYPHELSGGQRQRIAIARAILRDPHLLLLDEATSALDPATEQAINATLARLGEGRTVVSVLHRLRAAATMDQVAVIAAGRVVEQGSHHGLLAAGGLYASFWHRQMGGFDLRAGQRVRITAGWSRCRCAGPNRELTARSSCTLSGMMNVVSTR